jgi:pullulanase/glycogen debranching enzyme
VDGAGHGQNAETGSNAEPSAEITLLFINGDQNPITFHLPPPVAAWHCLLDSARPGQACVAVQGSDLVVEGKSLVLYANRALGPDHG